MEIQSLKLCWFSPTGTTRKIVESIAHGIGHHKAEPLDLTKPESRKRPLQLSGNELLIVGVPVYFGRVQSDALQCLRKLQAHNTPTVCVVVYGNREYDDALRELKQTLRDCGCIPIACAAYIGEHSFSTAETPIAKGRPDADDLLKAESLGVKIREKLAAISAIDGLSDIAVPGNYPYVDMADIRKRLSAANSIVVGDSCIQCGECAQHCPVGAIDPENSASGNKAQCILCHACIKSCPTNARKVKDGLVREIATRLSGALQARKEPVAFLQ